MFVQLFSRAPHSSCVPIAKKAPQMPSAAARPSSRGLTVAPGMETRATSRQRPGTENPSVERINNRNVCRAPLRLMPNDAREPLQTRLRSQSHGNSTHTREPIPRTVIGPWEPLLAAAAVRLPTEAHLAHVGMLVCIIAYTCSNVKHSLRNCGLSAGEYSI